MALMLELGRIACIITGVSHLQPRPFILGGVSIFPPLHATCVTHFLATLM